MAMNKKERAEFDAAIARANMLAALRRTEPVSKDVPPPDCAADRGDTTGWDFNTYTGTVSQYWSTTVSHGSGAKRTAYGSQNSKPLFSTRLLALKALRHATEIESATKLARIDEQINQECKESA